MKAERENLDLEVDCEEENGVLMVVQTSSV